MSIQVLSTTYINGQIHTPAIRVYNPQPPPQTLMHTQRWELGVYPYFSF